MDFINELNEANRKIEFLGREKEMRAEELVIANQELAFQNREKENRADELMVANIELAFQTEEKAKRADELRIANIELKFQNEEKENRADELVLANLELSFQNNEKDKRAAELVIANLELEYQNEEKEKRADELVLAYKELAFQKKKIRADELVIANLELAYLNQEKENPAAELLLANRELAFRKRENDRREGELEIASLNKQKEKRVAYLTLANKKLAVQKIQLEDFCNILSHNLRSPLVNISMLVDLIVETTDESEVGMLREQMKISSAILKEIFDELIESLQVKNDTEIKSKTINLKAFFKKTCDSLKAQIKLSKAVIESDFDESPLILFPPKYVISILQNLISNSLKYQSPERIPLIKVKSKRVGDKIVLSVSDNGLGIDLKKHKKDLFKIRKVFHPHPDAKGFGLFITKCQIEAMNGRIWAESKPDVGSTFYVEFNNQPL